MSNSSSESASSSPTFSSSSPTPATSRASSVSKQAFPEETPDDAAFPTAVLDTDTISPLLAARLCICILEHTLYLNGQIPFPIHSLSRLRLDGKAHAKAAKKRTDLLSALDILSTHLPSSFLSLSWAMAMNKALRRSRQTALHLMVITGPSPTAAKARCFIELDGFGIQVYGARDSDESPKDNGESTPRPQEKTDPSSPQQNDISSPPNIEESLQDEEEDVSSSEQGLEADNESILSSVSESCDEDQESDVDPGESSFISSISEAVSHMSLASDASTTSGSTCSSSDCDEYSESEDSLDLPEEPEIMESTNLEVQQNVPVVKADDEKFIASSVRSLSLAMASCCDFSRDDLAPTQVHLFLRAPRRFNHSSWLPKQNLQKSLDERLFSFFGQNGGNTKVFEEGVRVACELKLQEADEGQDSEKDSDSEEVDPEDDMIWWQWNAAPIRGFSDI